MTEPLLDRFNAAEYLGSMLTIEGDSIALEFADREEKRFMVCMSLATFRSMAFGMFERLQEIDPEMAKGMISPHGSG